MGYSLQYCENGCGNAVPGNECDWEGGVCDVCRERREDGAKGEAMTWTKEDTEALRGFHGMRQDSIADAIADEAFAARAAAHIEALEARAAELEGAAIRAVMWLREKDDPTIEPTARRLEDSVDIHGRAAPESRIATLEAEQSAMLASHLRRMVDIATERNKAEGVIREWAAAERGKYSDGGLCVPDEAYERWTKATEALLALAARLERKGE